MEDNKLRITIKKSISEVFNFTITPPNSTLWIPNVVKEETNEWPIHIGTIYSLQNSKNEQSYVIVTNLKNNEIVEWVSKDQNYHCRYTFRSIDKNVTKLEYYEWMNNGNLEEPFTMATLEKLKSVLEK
ncbi:MAG: hypothetical protein UR52_C0002G0069 [Candidatus Gottesmanbacteria bacterium GW2011_GWA1_34_13]|uniref:Uncharacterized protein n=1 Tax=Candidatus Gottesmanbacteria bacterium GW2011_GWA1_34_13 TaxID=1618434 RepID=A0A0G0B7Z4_9BACT|nr:MAG: hypothetical protein UR52_C0002G0069 [Candidatus Gottesmanbacteria bacterium GW2011_GWA1_34_13]